MFAMTDATASLMRPAPLESSIAPFSPLDLYSKHAEQSQDMPKGRSKAKSKGKRAPRPPPVDMILMDEIERAFLKAKEAGRAALVTYLPAGFPIPEMTHILMLEMQTAGADMIELGEPFSDPSLNSELIRAAHVQAMKFHVPGDFEGVASRVQLARKLGLKIPVFVRVHGITVRHYGAENIVKVCIRKSVRINGIVFPDATWEQVEQMSKACKKNGVAYAPHVGPEKTDEAVQKLCRLSNGLLYIAAGSWVAGRKQQIDKEISRILNQVESNTKYKGARLLELGKGDFNNCLKMDNLAEGLVLGHSILNATVDALDGYMNTLRVDEKAPFCLPRLRYYIETVMTEQSRAYARRRIFQMAGFDMKTLYKFRKANWRGGSGTTH